MRQNVLKSIHTCDVRTLLYTERTLNNSMFLENTSELEVFNILKSLKTNKSAGIDGIRPRDLKNNAKPLTSIITYIINSILNHSNVPDLFKIAIVRPIYKNGSKNDYNNYRPISILPVIEKIMEEVIVRRLTDFIERFLIIDKNQYGFQKNKSINMLLGNFANHVNTCLDENLHCLALFVDFSRAFDTLNHSKLLDTLQRIGVRGKCHTFFQAYLQCRRYRVKVKNNLSNVVDLAYGVPQGSKLGPLLYLIYANDLISVLRNSNTFAYADDTAIIVANKSLPTATNILQNEFITATKWCHDNGLLINASKTKVMHIKPHHFRYNEVKIKYHEIDCIHNDTICKDCTCAAIIELVHTYKYLGVYVDHNFKWRKHIEDVQKKLRKSLVMLYHLSNASTYSVLRQAYFSMTESYLRHGIAAWGSSTYCNVLQDTQNRVLKILWESLHKNRKYNNTPNASGNSLRESINSNHNSNAYIFNSNNFNINNYNINNYNTNTNNYNTNNYNYQISNSYINNYNTNHYNTNDFSTNTNNQNINNYNTNNHNTNNPNTNEYSHNSTNNIYTSSNGNYNSFSNNNNTNTTHINNNFTNSNVNVINYTNGDERYMEAGKQRIVAYNLAKHLKILNIENIYKLTLVENFQHEGGHLEKISHHYDTRLRVEGRYKPPKYRTNYGKSRIDVILPKILNDLPLNILEISHEHRRRKEMKNFYITRQ